VDYKKLGRYELRNVLGKGAMGVVYEGFDPALGRRVAVKTILKSVGLDPETEAAYAARFIQEAKAVARLNHANIVQVYDFSVESDVAYLVMEFIQGRELRSFFEAHEKFEPAEAVRVMGELLDALDFAHEAGVIHRDIKPANVMLDSQRRVKLADFGVARIQDSERSAAGTMVGTPAFMSPEQISGGKIDRRTDIFSAGTVLYQLLTGEQPFKGEGAWTVAKQIMQDDPPRPSTVVQTISPAFDAVVNKALAKKPAERFANAKEFAAALRGAFAPGSQAATVIAPAAAPVSPPKPKARVESKASEAEVEFWRALQNSTDADEFELYLEQFPDGTYAQLARHKIAKLRGPQDAARAAAEEKARQEAEEKARREAEQKAAQEAQARARREAEEKASQEAQARARREAEEKAAQEAQARAKREAAEKAIREAQEKAKREAAEKAKREAAEIAKREAEEKARRAQVLAKLKQQEEAAARAKPALDEDATVSLGRAATLPEPPAEPKRSKAIPIAAGAVAVVAAIGVAAYLMMSRTPAPAPVVQAPAVVPPTPATPAIPAAEIEKVKKETEERVRREFAEKSAAEQAAAAKAAVEKALQEKQLAAKAAAEKAAAEKIAAAKSAQEKAALEKAAAERAAAERAATEKAAAEKAAAQKVAAEKAAAEKAAAEKATAEKAAADKAAAENAAAERLATLAKQQSVAAAAPTPQGLVPGRYVFRLNRGSCGFVNISEDIEFRSSSQSISGTNFSGLRLKSEADGTVTGSVWDNSQKFGVGDVKLEAGRATSIGFAGNYNARYGQYNQRCSGPWSLWRTGG